MKQFIDKNALILDISNAPLHVTGMRYSKMVLADYTQKLRESMIAAIEKAPVEDVERVRHGTWITVGKTKAGTYIRMCSHCGRQRKGISKSAYCRDCGAKMDIQGAINEELC